MKNLNKAFLIMLLASLVTSTNGICQTQDSIKTKPFSFKPKPLPYCKHFMITEIGLMTSISNSQPDYRNEHWYWTWEFGMMGNINKQYALGGGLYVGAEEAGNRFAINPRVRRWIGYSSSVDLSALLFLGGKANGKEMKSVGIGGQIALNPSDYFSFTTQLEAIPYYETTLRDPDGDGAPPYETTVYEGTDVSWYLGLRMGAFGGVVGTVIVLGLAAAVAASW